MTAWVLVNVKKQESEAGYGNEESGDGTVCTVHQ